MPFSAVAETVAASDDAAWFLYLVELPDGKLYTGITKDVHRRFAEHQAGGRKAARCLRGKGPLRLVFFRPVGNHSQALKLEHQVKRLSALQKKALITSNFNLKDLPIAQASSKTT